MVGIGVDGSVLAAIAFSESSKADATALVTGLEMYAPPLMAYEITHIALKKIVRNPSQRLVTFNALDTTLGGAIKWMTVDFNKTLTLALETGLTAYDASYLYLAQTLGLPLATFDRKLNSAAQARGIS